MREIPINTNNVAALAMLAECVGMKRMSIWTPDGWKAPKGFPRRSLLCCPSKGGNTWQISPAGLLRYLKIARA